jgi:2'-5' RNA ligase
MRLFVALALPSQVADELDSVVAPLRPAWPGLRWTGRDAWHLTLSFLGRVDERVIGRLSEELASTAAEHPRLALSLHRAGAFPESGRRARVLWTGVRDYQQGLKRLAGSVGSAAAKAGAPPAEKGREYHPHLTLARCREPVDVRQLLTDLRDYEGTPWVADEIYLIRSHLGAHPRYETLGTWPLRSDERSGTGG